MNAVFLENDKLKVKVNCLGAELRSIYGKEKELEYLWNADAKFWNRSSPVLFPFVGSLKNKKYTHNGKEYAMGQHGFVRDMEFEVISKSDEEVWFSVKDTEETLAMYPFHFVVEIGYRLEGKDLRVMWKVKNVNDGDMHFSIGAHPAFFCPVYEGDKQTDYFVGLKDKDGNVVESFVNKLLADAGLTSTRTEIREYKDGLIPISEDLFDIDTLIIENDQVKRFALVDSNKEEYVAVEFDAPLVGIWSPPRKSAPFVCLEPWYGRCDCEEFDGELKDREYGNTIAAGEVFEAEYTIVIA